MQYAILAISDIFSVTSNGLIHGAIYLYESPSGNCSLVICS